MTLLHPIRTEDEYTAVLAEIERLFKAVPGASKGDQLEVLTTLVEAYEDRHHAMPPPDPVAALEYWMESRGLTRRDLEPCLGSRARVAEILNRKRALTIEMIRRLHHDLNIPAEILIQAYPLLKNAA